MNYLRRIFRCPHFALLSILGENENISSRLFCLKTKNVGRAFILTHEISCENVRFVVVIRCRNISFGCQRKRIVTFTGHREIHDVATHRVHSVTR